MNQDLHDSLAVLNKAAADERKLNLMMFGGGAVVSAAGIVASLLEIVGRGHKIWLAAMLFICVGGLVVTAVKKISR